MHKKSLTKPLFSLKKLPDCLSVKGKHLHVFSYACMTLTLTSWPWYSTLTQIF